MAVRLDGRSTILACDTRRHCSPVTGVCKRIYSATIAIRCEQKCQIRDTGERAERKKGGGTRKLVKKTVKKKIRKINPQRDQNSLIRRCKKIMYQKSIRSHESEGSRGPTAQIVYIPSQYRRPAVADGN